MSHSKELLIREKWQIAWQSRSFRILTIAGSFVLVCIFSFFPFFFQMIQRREGRVLNDWLLNNLPPHDVSVMIFLFIWAITLLACVRMVQQPDMFVTMLWAYILLSILRIASISAVALNPPSALIDLADPVSNFFYGKSYVTKDLFYSGHTSSVFLIFLCLKKRPDRVFALAGTILVGALLMIQHVHYTVDVLAAPVFAYICYLLSRKFTTDFSD